MERTAAAVDRCAICLGDILRGQAVFVAECSHSFHHRCISDSVVHGNRDCPLCKATWRDVPAVDPVPPQPPARKYADDEETVAQGVVQADADADAAGVAAADAGDMALKTHCEFPAVARDASHDNFAVLVHVRAPEAAAASADAARAPLDLVTVLDVSGSMQGSKLALLKQAMGFVIDNLGPADRLSIVSFSNDASREIRLTRMSGDGKASAKEAVESLVADGSTNISRGLLVASEVLADRRYRNAVTSVILLSDGQDNQSGVGRNHQNLVPPLFRDADSRPGSIHTFGFGSDHDAAAMHAIAEVARGTFSFVENLAVIQDSFAQCIGGLLSVVAQNARIAVDCVPPGVRVRQVKSGRYESSVDAEGRAASVNVGELYAEEERRFLLFVDVPRAEASEDVTQLVRVRCTYRNVVTGATAADVVVSGDAVVQRPVEVSNPEVCMEVERERVRVGAAEEIAAARAAAERGAFSEAGRILECQRYSLRKLAPGMARDEMCLALEDELEELVDYMVEEKEYVTKGRARVLERISSHASYGASYGGVPPGAAPRAYRTPAMESMLHKSKKSREKQSSPPPPTKRKHGGSK
ncbi:hypothetical protein BDA96_01G241400 [Sorghum bicolor]|uniref:VWFA domain-containing protein n=2 Tax=Sorghum bicolor TaxID=4558 RepID=A0A921S2E8_SORBI|nr:uncharacterized protein LOC8070508 [Sorghum bicolor]EER91509.1 hypothetical protein SORBI_3001G227000 [Sorghum bicolor]KAG0549277.1 hypothetical protein BDA96_01G241400 [Sorghum bicolor]|eukprot:XP_002464511.1 uncharacterized protein LOC8070508 [Sorghum bicolor]